MIIREVDINSTDYKSLSKSIGSAFNSVEWLNVYSRGLKVYGIYNKGNKLIGFFNLYFEKKYGLTHLKNPPFTPSIALCFDNPSSNPSKKQSFDKSIYRLVQEFISEINASIVTITLPVQHADMQPFVWAGFKVVPNYTYHLSLVELTEDDVLKQFSPERRNDIKKALKDGVVCEQSNDYSLVKTMVEFTYDRKGKQLKSDLLSRILEQMKGDNSFAYVSYMNSKPIAAAFVVYDKNTAYYLLGGYDPENRHQGAGALAVYSAILQTKKLGVPIFDFEGSMLQEVERYFRGFGGELKVMFTINKALFPLEVVLKHFKRSIF